MKRDWKDRLFQAYEEEEKFRDNKDKVKQRLTFVPKKEKKPIFTSGLRYLAIASSLCVVVASGFALGSLFVSGDKSDKVAFDTDKDSLFMEVPTGSKDVNSVTFGEHYSFSYSYLVEKNALLISDDYENLNLSLLSLKEGKDVLPHNEENDTSFFCYFTTLGNHDISWNYQNYNGTFQVIMDS